DLSLYADFGHKNTPKVVFPTLGVRVMLGFLIGRLNFPPLFVNIKLFDPLPLFLAPVLKQIRS
ncbi:hypothetical protein, partial [Lactobacillus sp. MRS-253-APC-2B]|uniref:hypothetical protein n=1 Tax=Lactobacillus sp. MRS-253-APC-2B TaxID=2725305 RepID=UPI00197FA337